MHAAINSIAKIPSLEHRSRLCWRLWVSVTLTVTITPCQAGRALVWDFTCPDTYVASNVALATREAGALATSAERRKSNTFEELAQTHHMAPLAIETSGVFGQGT